MTSFNQITTQIHLKSNSVWATIEEFYVAIANFHSIFAHRSSHQFIWIEICFGFATVQSIFVDDDFAETGLQWREKLQKWNNETNTVNINQLH